MKVYSDRIPQSLRQPRQWINWRYEAGDDGKQDKIPYRPSGYKASTTNPKHWATFNEALAAHERGDFDGVGFVFSKDDDLFGIDLDGCRNPDTGEFAPWALEILERTDTYAEVSPSGLGVKLFCTSATPIESYKVNVNAEPLAPGKTPGVEIYSQGRYFCVTGCKESGSDDEPTEQNEIVDWIRTKHPKHPKPSTNGKHTTNGAASSKAKPNASIDPYWTPERRMKRAEAYIGKLPPAVSKQRGHDRTYEVARYLVEFGIDRPDADAFMRVWNQSKADPPWSDKELNHKLDQAYSRGGFGDKLGPAPEKEAGKTHGIGNGKGGGNLPLANDSAKSGDLAEAKEAEKYGLDLLRADQVEIELLEWDADHLILANELNQIHARGGVGKSMVAASIAADRSAGRSLLGLPGPGREPCDVLMACFEDDVASVVVPRLKAHGADLSRIHFIQGVKNEDGSYQPFDYEHVPLIDRLTEDRPEIRLVIVDPAPAMLTGDLNPNVDKDVRKLTIPLLNVAHERKVTFLFITHDSKANHVAYAAARTMGSVAWVNSCRQNLAIIVDDKQNRILVSDKVNHTGEKRGRMFRMEAIAADRMTELRADAGLRHLNDAEREKLIGGLCRVAWCEAPEELDIEEFVKATTERNPVKVIDRCKDFLKKFLADFAFPSVEIDEACRAEGFGIQAIKQAKKELKEEGVICNHPFGFGKDWWSGPGTNWRDWVKRPECDTPPTHTGETVQSVPDCPTLADDSRLGQSVQTRTVSTESTESTPSMEGGGLNDSPF